MLSLIIAEASLELIPKKIRNHPSVVSHSRRLGKKPSEILLDNSWHFAAMKGLENEIKRGRPDIVHISLLQACSIPLFFEKKIQIFIHTINDQVITVGNKIRLPKSYHRFAGLMEQLFLEKIIQRDNEIFLKLEEMDFAELIEMINPTKVIGFSSEGQESSFSDISSKLDENSCIVVGGFQKGHFSDSIIKKLTELKKIGKNSFEAHVVISRILYEYEKTIFM